VVVIEDRPTSTGFNRCPIIRDPHQELAELFEFDQLREHLAILRSGIATLQPVEFPRGAIGADGRLDLCKQGLGAEGTKAVMADIAGTPIRHVLLGTNAIGSIGLNAVATAIVGTSTIESVYLGCNGITAETLPILTEAVVASSSVQAVWLKRNPLGPASASHLATMISESQLCVLDLVATGLSDQSFAILAPAIAGSSLRHLFVSGNNLTPATCELLVDWISGPSCEGLHISANPIADDGVRILAEALEQRARPIDISIASVGVTAASASDLARVAAIARRLDIGRSSMARAVGAVDNVLGDKPLASLSSQFSTLALRSLDLRHCGASDVAAHALVSALHGAHSLEILTIGPNISRRLKAELRQLLCPPREEWSDWHITSRYR
jgi:hypothetical protein